MVGQSLTRFSSAWNVTPAAEPVTEAELPDDFPDRAVESTERWLPPDSRGRIGRPRALCRVAVQSVLDCLVAAVFPVSDKVSRRAGEAC